MIFPTSSNDRIPSPEYNSSSKHICTYVCYTLTLFKTQIHRCSTIKYTNDNNIIAIF